MKSLHFLIPGTALIAISAGIGAAPATAQTPGQPAAQPVPQSAFIVPPTPNADRLAAQMRILASNPRDVEALIAAGLSSVRLNDPEAALQFFGRADGIAPGDPRILAGRGGALVALERPGEAMALFRRAQAAGVPESAMALDRGLAFDLLGYPRNAQRDYRIVLSQGPNDEATRRLSLSLGISGDLSEAEAVLEPLLRVSNRPAWRVRACILAMNGKTEEADKIAASMLPGFGPSLSPFFRRLSGLSASDRAFAVNFGRLGRSADRSVDAAKSPPIVALEAPAKSPPATQLASTRGDSGKPERRSRRRREKPAVIQTASVTTVKPASVVVRPAAPVPVPVPVPPKPVVQAVAVRAAPVRSVSPLTIRPVLVRVATVAPVQLVAAPGTIPPAIPVRVAAVTPRPAEALYHMAATVEPVPAALRASRIAVGGEIEPARVATQSSEAPDAGEARQEPDATPAPEVHRENLEALGEIVGRLGEASDDHAPIAAPDEPELVETPAKVETPPAPAGEFVAKPFVPDPSFVAPPESTRPAAQGDVIGRVNTPPLAPADAPKTSVVADDPPPPQATTPEAVTPEPVEVEPVSPVVAPLIVADHPPANYSPGARRSLPDPALTEPARTWVQVASGADDAALPSTWAQLSAKAPDAFQGQAAWSTPLNATNRLLAGPFDTVREAQAFANQLAAAGISAFTWTSAGGQPITRLQLP